MNNSFRRARGQSRGAPNRESWRGAGGKHNHGTHPRTFLRHAQMTKTMTRVTRMFSETPANDGNMVLQPPRVPILETTHWRSPQRHTVPPSSKACSYQILTVPPTTPAACSHSPGLWGCIAAPQCPPLLHRGSAANVRKPASCPTSLSTWYPPGSFALNLQLKKRELHCPRKLGRGNCRSMRLILPVSRSSCLLYGCSTL